MDNNSSYPNNGKRRFIGIFSRFIYVCVNPLSQLLLHCVGKIRFVACQVRLCSYPMSSHATKNVLILEVQWSGSWTYIQWVKLSDFKSTVLQVIRPPKKEIFGRHDPGGIERVFQLRVGLSPLRVHKKAHNFQDTSDGFCLCGGGVENTTHFLISCPVFSSFFECDNFCGIVTW